MKTPESDSLATIESWFQKRCDGLWEHKFGLKLETTDNPGWLISVDETIETSVIERLCQEVKQSWGAECILYQRPFKVYATSLVNCMGATAHVLSSRNAKQQ